MNFRYQIEYEGKSIITLRDILPDKPKSLKMLIIGKRPSLVSVKKGHYLQGKQGKMFWKILQEYGLFNVPIGKYEDEVLLMHGYGLSDIVKVPSKAGIEPSNTEYKNGIPRLKEVINKWSPSIILFVYKKPLDMWLKIEYKKISKSIYGFNDNLKELFGRKVFVFPMPGTPCNKEEANLVLKDLFNEIHLHNVNSPKTLKP